MSTTPPQDPHAMLLGEIKGQLQALHEGQQRIESAVNVTDGRLRDHEIKMAKTSLAASTFWSVGMALVIEGLKRFGSGIKG